MRRLGRADAPEQLAETKTMNFPGRTVVTTGLRFPEGPVAMEDGSVLVVEMRGKTLTRVEPNGDKKVVAQLAGGPNGAAIGPDGRCYICNNGGFGFKKFGSMMLPGIAPPDYTGGWIEAVDLKTGQSEVIYRTCGDIQLRGPNDLIFDQYGGFWFTDTGKIMARQRDRGAVFYARIDGSFIKQAIFPLDGPNGIGLSPDDRTLYVAESWSGRVWSYEITGPGQVRKFVGPMPWERGRLLIGMGGYSLLDSLAIDGAGNICVANIPYQGITVFSPEGEIVEQHAMPDTFVTNICFGGPALRTAYITLSSAGQLISMPWPRGGLPLHFLNRHDRPCESGPERIHP